MFVGIAHKCVIAATDISGPVATLTVCDHIEKTSFGWFLDVDGYVTQLAVGLCGGNVSRPGSRDVSVRRPIYLDLLGR